jgi:hypothetical protein
MEDDLAIRSAAVEQGYLGVRIVLDNVLDHAHKWCDAASRRDKEQIAAVAHWHVVKVPLRP